MKMGEWIAVALMTLGTILILIAAYEVISGAFE
jgi:hypothetical protein